MVKKNYKIFRKVFKFPYSGSFETNENEMLSETVCWYTIKVCKKIIEAAQWKIFYLEVTFNLTSDIVPSQAIDLPIFSSATPIERVMDFNSVVKPKISPVINNRSDKVIYQEIAIKEIDSIISRFMKGDIDAHQLDLILQLKGGDGFTNLVAISGFVILIN